MADEKKAEDGQVVQIPLKDLKGVLSEMVLESDAKLNKAHKEDYLKGNVETKEKVKEAKKQSDTAMFFKHLTEGNKAAAREVASKSIGAANYQMKSLNTSDDGQVVPEEFDRDLITDMYDYSQTRQNANIATMSAPVKKLNEVFTKVSVSKVGENVNVTASEPTFQEPTLTAEKYMGATDWTMEFKQDMEIDATSELRRQFAERFAANEQNSHLNSAVSGSEGILQAANTVTYFLGGGSASGSTTIDSMTVTDLLNASNENAEPNRKIYLSRTAANQFAADLTSDSGSTFNNVIQMKDGDVSSIYSIPVVIIESDRDGSLDMLPQLSDTAVNTAFGFIADLKRTFYIADYLATTFDVVNQGTFTDAGSTSRNLTMTGGEVLRGFKRSAQATVRQEQITLLSTSAT